MRRPIKRKAVVHQLFDVWVDSNCGYGPEEWDKNSQPKPLAQALDEAAECRRMQFPAKVMLETPRPKGIPFGPVGPD